MKGRVLAALLAVPALLAAQEAAPEQTRVHLGIERSHLDNGYTPWTDVALGVSRRWGPRQLFEATLLETERFDVKDTQVGVGFATPLSPQLTLSADATASPTHRVLARHSAGAVLAYEFAPAWLVHGGARYTRYEDTDVLRGTFMLERYFGNFSAAAAWYPVRAFGTHAHSVDLRAAWYYGDRSSVSLILADGDEVTQVGPGSVVLAPVRSAAFTGRHALGAKTALTWSLFHVRQGGFYTRQGFSAGVQHAF